jgi:hypothetical protein
VVGHAHLVVGHAHFVVGHAHFVVGHAHPPLGAGWSLRRAGGTPPRIGRREWTGVSQWRDTPE